MSVLFREEALAWLAALALGVSTALSALRLLADRGRRDADRFCLPARWCAGAGGYFLLLSLAARGIATRGWPLGSTYEAVLLSAAALALFHALGTPRRLAAIGGVCAGLGSLLMVVLALLLTPAGTRMAELPPPALAGIWFPIHVLASAIGYGGLLLAGGAGLFRFLGGRGAASSSLASDLEAVAGRAVAWGYPWLTLGMTTGAVWSWLAWGRYWSWSVKEVLTLLTWGIFTLAFHTRRLEGWRGRPHAAVLAAGLLALLVTLLAAEGLARRVVPGVEYLF